MESKKDKSIFKQFNLWPFEQEFRYTQDLIRGLGKTGSDVEQKEIARPPDDLDGHLLGDKAEKLWKTSLSETGGNKPNLSKVLLRCLFWDYSMAILLAVFTRLILVLMLVEFLRRLLFAIEKFNSLREPEVTVEIATYIDLFSSSNTSNYRYISVQTNSTKESILEEEIYEEIVLLALGVLACLSANIILTSFCEFLFMRCGLKCRVIMTQLIRRKSLRMRLATSIRDSSNRALGLVSNEVALLEGANRELMYLFTGPLSLALAVIWMASTQELWEPAVLTVPCLLGCILLQLYLQSVYKRISKRHTLETNKRLDIMGTALSSMKVVKLYAWESLFVDKVRSHREAGLVQLNLLDRFTILDMVLFGALVRIVPSIIFLANIFIAGDLNEQTLFTSSVVLCIWRTDGNFFFPRSVRALSDMKTACENAEKYLLLDEFVDQRKEMDKTDGRTRISCESLQVSLGLANDNATKGAEDNQGITRVIDGLDMQLESGDLVFVLGRIGSGKSSLLLTLLGETRITSGSLRLTKGSRFAYASQEPCLFSDTLRNNIINGRPFDADRYSRVLDICSLRRDLGQLPNSDQTLVGSRGVALSGGQKARLSLARAIYSRADVYLLDDPLSALDGKVAREIFTNCICDFLADKLVVLVTHQVQFLESASKVVILSRDSKPIFGPTKEVMQLEECRSMLDEFRKLSPEEAGDSPDQSLEEASGGPNTINNEKLDTSAPVASDSELRDGDSHPAQQSNYSYFLKLGFSNKQLLFLSVNHLIFVGFASFSEYSLYLWSEQLETHRDLSRLVPQNNSHNNEEKNLMIEQWLMFMGISILYLASFWYYLVLLNKGLRRAAARLHDNMTDSLFKARMSFYDFCQAGNLSSCYAGDFTTVDLSTVITFVRVIVTSMYIGIFIIAMGAINVILALPFLLVFIVMVPLARRRYRDSRKLLDLNKDSRSPMFTALTWAIDELSTVRSEQDHLSSAARQFNRNQNRWTSLTLLCCSYNARLIITIKIGLTVINSIIFILMFGRVFTDEIRVSPTGAALMIAIQISCLLPTNLELFSALEASMIAVSNVRALAELEPEEKPEGEKKVAKQERQPVERTAAPRAISWPTGGLSFNGVTLRYSRAARPAIDGLTFSVAGGERVGVVGRTGAGKSSVLSALYRLYPLEGTILIDGVDTASLRLCELRRSLGIIPQEPVLFTDSLRRNLDPSGEFADEQLWRALDIVHLKRVVLEDLGDKLEQQISEGGRNFSVGQRQLICLARAVLRSPKILLIDEATANVDRETDALIQRTIREQFANCTVVTIAHRLNTILDYDRVMVLDSGRLVEFDTLANLLQIEGGIFKAMLESSKVKLNTS